VTLVEGVNELTIQKRIEKYWSGEAVHYSESIQDELSSFKKDAWLDLLVSRAPDKEKLTALDIGTGPGFFAIILSMTGHAATGIDCTEDMLACARMNAEEHGASPRFVRMDTHDLAFEDDSFDLVVCRNLTWTLHEPEAAYREWLRVLKPGGVLLIFDANWHLWMFDEEMARKRSEDKLNVRKLGLSEPHGHVDMEESDRISKELPLSRTLRPQWDVLALSDCGFTDTFVDADITDRVWDEREKHLYRSTPMFLVGGRKK
jgi:ubiquinone/menaquinone biosynthesis C-methylase UbiE